MSDFKDITKDMTKEFKPWHGNEVRPFTEEQFIEALRKSGPLGEYWADKAKKILKEKKGKE